MSAYIDLGGVRTWYDELGDRGAQIATSCTMPQPMPGAVAIPSSDRRA